MPTYLFKNTKTGEVVEHVIKIAQYDSFVETNPDLERYYDAAHISSLIRGINMKPDAGFREVLKNIKSKHRRSTINDF